jgi:hypothetical protein
MIPFDNVSKLGIIVDTPAHELPVEAWSGGNNIRFENSEAKKIEGEVPVYGTPNVPPHWALAWQNGGTFTWIYAGTTQVHTYTTVHLNITRFTTTQGDNDYVIDARPVWTGGVLHGVPILNTANGVDYPQQWDGTLGRLKDLTAWPVNEYAAVIRTYKNFILALNITKATGNFPYIVKWSHPADPGTVPISWDPTDPTKLAGEEPVSQSGGFLVDCLPLAGVNIVYKTDAIWGMQLTGGLDVFRIYEITQKQGLLAPNCVVGFKRQHFVVGPMDIVLFDGVNVVSVISKRMRKKFYGVLSSVYYDKTYVIVNEPRHEILINFVETGSIYPNKTLIWNYDDRTWALKDIDDVAFMAAGEITDGVADTFDAAVGTIEAETATFNAGAGAAPSDTQILQVSPTSGGRMLHAEVGYLQQGSPFLSYLERTGLSVVGIDRQGNPKLDVASVKFVRSVYPKIAASVAVLLNVYVGMQETIGGAVTWEGPYVFNSGTDVKVDFAISGKFVAVKFEDADGNVLPWSVAGYVLDLEVISKF